MNEYFKLWRHRFGIAILVQALSLVGEWFRSFAMADEIWAGAFGWHVGCASAMGRLRWISFLLPPPRDHEFITVDSVSLSAFGQDRYMAFCERREHQVVKIHHAVVTVFSHWVVITPLTIVSVYLLKSHAKKARESVLRVESPE